MPNEDLSTLAQQNTQDLLETQRSSAASSSSTYDRSDSSSSSSTPTTIALTRVSSSKKKHRSAHSQKVTKLTTPSERGKAYDASGQRLTPYDELMNFPRALCVEHRDDTRSLFPHLELEADALPEGNLLDHLSMDSLVTQAHNLKKKGHLLAAAYTYWAIMSHAHFVKPPEGNMWLKNVLSGYARHSQALASIVSDPFFSAHEPQDKARIYFAFGLALLQKITFFNQHRLALDFGEGFYIKQCMTCFAMAYYYDRDDEYIKILSKYEERNFLSSMHFFDSTVLRLIEDLTRVYLVADDSTLDYLEILKLVNNICAKNKKFRETFAKDPRTDLPLYDGTAASLISILGVYHVHAYTSDEIIETFNRGEKSHSCSLIPAQSIMPVELQPFDWKVIRTQLPKKLIDLAIDQTNSRALLPYALQFWLWHEARKQLPELKLTTPAQKQTSSSTSSATISDSASSSSFWPRLPLFASKPTTTQTPPIMLNAETLTRMQEQLKTWLGRMLNRERQSAYRYDIALLLYQQLLFITPRAEIDTLQAYPLEDSQHLLLVAIQSQIAEFYTSLNHRINHWPADSVKCAPAQRLLATLQTASGLTSTHDDGELTFTGGSQPHLTLWQLIHEFKRTHPEDYQTLYERQGLGILAIGTLSKTAELLQLYYEDLAQGDYAAGLKLMTHLCAAAQQLTDSTASSRAASSTPTTGLASARSIALPVQSSMTSSTSPSLLGSSSTGSGQSAASTAADFNREVREIVDDTELAQHSSNTL